MIGLYTSLFDALNAVLEDNMREPFRKQVDSMITAIVAARIDIIKALTELGDELRHQGTNPSTISRTVLPDDWRTHDARERQLFDEEVGRGRLASHPTSVRLLTDEGREVSA